MMYANYHQLIRGRMVELVDTRVLGTRIARCEGSSPFSPTKNDYANNYDMLVLSTNKKRWSVVLIGNSKVGGLRKNHTFHLNYTCDYYSLIRTGFIKLTSSTPVRWSCRRYSNSIRRHTLVLVFNKEMFSICPQNNTKHNSSYN